MLKPYVENVHRFTEIFRQVWKKPYSKQPRSLIWFQALEKLVQEFIEKRLYRRSSLFI